MTLRTLGTRLGKLEADAPGDRGNRIDPATLTDEELAVLEDAPRFADGELDFDSMSDAELRVIAAIGQR